MIGICVGYREGGTDGVSAKQPLGAPGRRDRRHGIRERKADQAVLGCTVGVVSGSAEMAAVAHRNRTKPILLRDTDRHVCRTAACHQPQSVIGVEYRAAGHGLRDLERRLRLDGAIE